MKTYEVTLFIQATKLLVVQAEDEDDAENIAYEICDSEGIPVSPFDEPEIYVDNIIAVEEVT